MTSTKTLSPPQAPGRPRTQGFTLVELMVTIAVAGIILTVGVPSFMSVINGSRLTTTANDLLGDMAYARTEAMRRGQRVTICTSNNTNVANPTCTGTPWTDGWIIFEDLNRNTAFEAGETLLRVHEATPGNITVTGTIDVATMISYTQSGNTRLFGLAGAAQGGTIRVCMPVTSPVNNARDIVLDASGSGRAAVIPQDLGGACPAP
ncbi:MAG: GspH/FimT family pseudopilin [Pseudomonadota bacterium]